MTTRLLHGAALTQLKTLPDESVHCVVTSPKLPIDAGRGTCSYCKRKRVELYWTSEGLGKCRLPDCRG